MSTDLTVDRHSSVAEFELVAQGHSYDVAEIAPEFLVLETPCEIPAGPAELIIRLEGEETRRQITLVDGASGRSGKVRISRD